METIGQRIKRIRKEKGLTADDLAKEAGVNRATIFRYESSDIKRLSGQSLTAIAAALGTTAERLVGWDNEQEPGEALTHIAANLRNWERVAAAQLAISMEAVEVARAYDESIAPIQTAVKKLLDVPEAGTSFAPAPTEKQKGD